MYTALCMGASCSALILVMMSVMIGQSGTGTPGMEILRMRTCVHSAKLLKNCYSAKSNFLRPRTFSPLARFINLWKSKENI